MFSHILNLTYPRYLYNGLLSFWKEVKRMASTGNYIGNYKIIDQLSSDAVNYVYLAEHISSPGRPVVLKVFTTFLNSAEESNAFLQEAYSLVRLRRSEEHTSELQSQSNLVCRLLLEKKKSARLSQ